ncbi:unnamed protein product [Camellia sinensis]
MSSSMENNPLPLIPGRVVIAYDATKDRNERELKRTFCIGSHTPVQVHVPPIVVGYQIGSPVSKKTDMYVNMLQQSAEECKKERGES